MQQGIKLVSINIECDRHYERLFPFVAQEKPDVICLQETLERDMARLSQTFAMTGQFVPMGRLSEARFVARGLYGHIFGLSLFARFPALFQTEHYCGTPGTTPWQKPDNQGVNKMLLSAAFEVGGKPYRISTTHFTWTPDGSVSEAQRQDMKRFLEILEKFPEIIFCGDFNAPRGGEIWAELARHYRDNIPPECFSSIDPDFHRVKHLVRMVDGLFSTPGYRVSGVRLIEGVSDHKAVVGYIERV